MYLTVILTLLVCTYSNRMVVTAEELSIQAYENSNLGSYIQLVVDEEYNQVLIGAKEVMLRLSSEHLGLLETARWESTAEDKITCTRKGFNEEMCHNYIQMLIPVKMNVVACGTNSAKSMCSVRKRDMLNEETLPRFSGRGINPYLPVEKGVGLATSTHRFFVGTFTGPQHRDPTISGGIAPNYIRTKQDYSLWLDRPQFVSAYEIGDNVYFFFREAASEGPNREEELYSRVARVCKEDLGFVDEGATGWTTFRKVRLTCPLSGQQNFNYLQSTFYSEARQRVYALFTTQNDSAGLAVCSYTLSKLEESFGGLFKVYTKGEWKNKYVEELANLACPEPEKKLEFILKTQPYVLMAQPVQPTTTEPIVNKTSERWTHLVVDHVPTRLGHVDVFFVATNQNKILKLLGTPPSTNLVTSSNPDSTCLLEEMTLPQGRASSAVKVMELSQNKTAIYVAMDGKILKIPVYSCDRYTDRRSCTERFDPYCGWNHDSNECTTPPQGQIDYHRWEQNTDAALRCPNLEPLHTVLTIS